MKKNSYYELKKKHQQEVNNFPMAFAFSNKQFEAGMRKLGLEPTDTDKVYFLGGTGGFYRKSDAKALHEMFERHDKEMKEAINADTTGDGFICDMFSYELANHEYGYTYELDDTLDALGLTMDEINSKENLKQGLKLALGKY
jgi:hypothetical protein